MKKLGKLSINPERVIKNEELVNLRGGYYGGSCTPVSKGSGYWQCCCGDTPQTIYKDNADAALTVCKRDYCSNCSC